MRKKLLFLSAVAAAIVCLCAGCSGGASSAQSAQGAGADSGLEPVTLHFIFWGEKKSATDKVWSVIADYTRDTLNCDFDIRFVDEDNYQSTLLAMAKDGEEWDLNYDSDWTGYYQMAAAGAYMDLEELLPEYAPELYQAYQEQGILEAICAGGRLTCLPWTMVRNDRPFLQWRGDLADAAGIQVDKERLTTIEAVDAFLHQLKEAYPDRYIIECSQVLGNSWMEIDRTLGIYVNLQDPDCTVTAVEDVPEFLTAARYAEKWQKDGIIWKGALSEELDYNMLIDEGKLITKWGTYEFIHAGRTWEEEGARWDYAELYPEEYYANATPFVNGMCIPATSRHADRTLMFLNMLETDQTLYDLVQYGIEGITYELEDGEVCYPDGMETSNSNYLEWKSRWALWKTQFMRADANYKEGFWQEVRNFVESNEKNVVSPLEGFVFDDSSVAKEGAARKTIYTPMEKRIRTGLAGDADEAVERLRAESIAAGFDRYIAEYQRQVDAFRAGRSAAK